MRGSDRQDKEETGASAGRRLGGRADRRQRLVTRAPSFPFVDVRAPLPLLSSTLTQPVTQFPHASLAA